MGVTFHGKNTHRHTKKKGKKTKYNTAKWKIIKYIIFQFLHTTPPPLDFELK